MRRRDVVRGVLGATALAVLAGVMAHCRVRIDEGPPPSEAQASWALGALDAARLGNARPAPVGDYQGAGPTFVTAWHRGAVLARHIGGPSLIATVDEAAAAFLADRALTDRPAWSSEGEERVRFTVEVSLGEGPLDVDVPYLQTLTLVPLREGVVARLDGRSAYVSVEELRARQAYDSGIPTPVPELTLGIDMEALLGRLARDLGVDVVELMARGEVRRLRLHTLAPDTYPRRVEVTEEALREAAREGAAFLLRHQKRDGSYTYVYDGARGRERPETYNIPRHSGTTYFLAQVDRLDEMPEARAGALAALRWLERHRQQRCGEHICIESYGRADVGSAALTVVAAAELLAKEDAPVARRLAEGLSAFLRAQQREDGELMHEYDLSAQAPVDVQHMYYSGEAAFALLKAHEVLGDEANVEAARRLMAHLTGAGWDFLGSRYYYGEEHWTCIAAGEARGRVDTDASLDFCRRWFEFNDALQYREGQTPWDVEGAFGVGPIIVPRLTPVGSRTEAFVATYRLFRHHGADAAELRALVERGLGQLLRWRWAPGPTHLLADPAGARGGMPGSPVDLTVRNDFVQHAGSAWIRWADVLRQEREATNAH